MSDDLQWSDCEIALTGFKNTESDNKIENTAFIDTIKYETLINAILSYSMLSISNELIIIPSFFYGYFIYHTKWYYHKIIHFNKIILDQYLTESNNRKNIIDDIFQKNLNYYILLFTYIYSYKINRSILFLIFSYFGFSVSFFKLENKYTCKKLINKLNKESFIKNI